MVDCDTQVDIHSLGQFAHTFWGNPLFSTLHLVLAWSLRFLHLHFMSKTCSVATPRPTFNHAHKLGIDTNKTQPLSQISQSSRNNWSNSRTLATISIILLPSFCYVWWMRGIFLTLHEASGTLKVGAYKPLLLVCCVTHFSPIFSTPFPLKELRTPRSSKFGQLLEGSQWRQKCTGKNLPVALESHLLVKVYGGKSSSWAYLLALTLGINEEKTTL